VLVMASGVVQFVPTPRTLNAPMVMSSSHAGVENVYVRRVNVRSVAQRASTMVVVLAFDVMTLHGPVTSRADVSR
jgi:hypothetical protein